MPEPNPHVQDSDVLTFEQWSQVWHVVELGTGHVTVVRDGQEVHRFEPTFDGSPVRYSRAIRVLADLVEVTENEELGEESPHHHEKILLVRGRTDAEKFWTWLQLWMDLPPAKTDDHGDHWYIRVPEGEHLEFYLIKYIREEGGKLNLVKVLLPHELPS